jgi:hypothetical protein
MRVRDNSPSSWKYVPAIEEKGIHGLGLDDTRSPFPSGGSRFIETTGNGGRLMKKYKVLELESENIAVQFLRTVKYYYAVVLPALIHFTKENN